MDGECGKIVSICISDRKGVCKKPVESAKFIENYGIEGDAHSGFDTLRQVSLLSVKSISKMKDLGLNIDFGSFAENIVVSQIDFSLIKIGDRFKLGKDVIIEITQIGKECHGKCSIYYKTGYCIMPEEGVFAKVIKGGYVKKDDEIKRIKEETG